MAPAVGSSEASGFLKKYLKQCYRLNLWVVRKENVCRDSHALCVAKVAGVEGPPVLSTQSDGDVQFKLTSNRLHFFELLDLTKGCAFKPLDLTCDFFVFPKSGSAAPSIRGKVSDHADALFITDL